MNERRSHVDIQDIRKAWHLAFAIAVMIGAALLIWTLSYVLLLVFAALIVATIIRGTASPLIKHTPLNEPMALTAALLGIMAVVGTFLTILGGQVKDQFSELAERLPELIDMAGEAVGVPDFIEEMIEMLPEMIEPGTLAGGIGAGLTGIAGMLSALVLVLVCGIYLALSPRPYWRGTLLLFPQRYRDKAEDAMTTSARALRLWLLGQLVAMLVIGVATTLAMMALGLPSALAIGVIAGVLEFIPFLGPILAAIPAILVALGEGGNMVFWVLGVYILIQQIEGNVLIPLIQRRAVRLPPVLGLFAILVFGILFGPVGILLATPLTIVIMVLVQKLYVRDALKEDIKDATET